MTKLQRKLTASLATFALMANMVVPVTAATTLEIIGNGADSDSEIDYNANKSTNVIQNNVSDVKNSIQVQSNTGVNQASRNTGGMVRVDTGNSAGYVTVSNLLNSNHAELDCCDTGDTDVLIQGNGADSDNEVDLQKNDVTGLFQTNVAKVRNNVDVDASTGKNRTDSNTGADVEVNTGDARMEVMLETVANNNTARIGSNGGDTGTLSARIIGNGEDSDNEIDLNLNRSTLLTQANLADVKNNVDAELITGKNEAGRNTGGEVEIDTGNAIGFVDIYNTLNFNTANVDCGCIMSDVYAKIAENGADSDNEIEADFSEELDLFQNNVDRTRNYVDMELETGRNKTDRNVGDSNSDPAIWTGNAYGDVIVENVANSNAFGQGSTNNGGNGGHGYHIPVGHGFNLSFSFDLNAFLAALGLDL